MNDSSVVNASPSNRTKCVHKSMVLGAKKNSKFGRKKHTSVVDVRSVALSLYMTVASCQFFYDLLLSY